MITKKIKCPNCGVIQTINGHTGEQKKITCQSCNQTGIFQFPSQDPSLSQKVEDTIIVQNLSKHYNELRATDNVSFSVKKGEIFGFLGPNGAGKTTTIKAILGLLHPNKGRILINNSNIVTHEKKAKKNIGYLPEKVAFYDNLSGLQNLHFYAEMKHLPKSTAKPLLKDLGLEHAGDKKVGEYSKGMVQRLGVARALLGSPPLLILDEPSSGLDPRGVVLIREKILKMKDQGTTIFVSSHILNEIQEICDRVGIINKGRLVAIDTISKLGEILQLKPKIILKLKTVTEPIIQAVEKVNGVSNIHQYKNNLEVMCPAEEKASVIIAVSKAGGVIKNIRTKEPSLEDVFMRFTEET
ncbi:MAG: ATP-binding cassette domain-containing protein [Candidatus Heimdallarchaeota archaeon]|nr:ATP-binding cassette domain-containing protein [Candidatus Heimdallarchaeota archaeon]